MDTTLQEAIKKANTEVEQIGINDPEMKKIAFSKAIDFYLGDVKEEPRSEQTAHEIDTQAKQDFWSILATATGIGVKRLKDLFSIKDEQIQLIIPSIQAESKTDQRRILAALILLAYHEGLGYEWVSSGLLAEAAKNSKLYSNSKFAQNLKHDWFRSQGIKRGLKYKLSGPGMSEAKTILTNLTQSHD